MKWDEFRTMLIGIAPETPLGRIVSIRAETDKNILKHFSPEQHRIRNEWRSKKIKKVTDEQMTDVLEGFKKIFIQMAGGVKN